MGHEEGDDAPLTLAGQAALIIGRHRMRKFSAAMDQLETDPGISREDLPAITQGILQLSSITGGSSVDRGRLTEDGPLIPVPGMTPGAIGDLPDTGPGKYWPAGEDEGHG